MEQLHNNFRVDKMSKNSTRDTIYTIGKVGVLAAAGYLTYRWVKNLLNQEVSTKVERQMFFPASVKGRETVLCGDLAASQDLWT